MNKKGFIGEFEQVVLLAILQLKDEAYGPDISRKLEVDAGPSRLPRFSLLHARSAGEERTTRMANRGELGES